MEACEGKFRFVRYEVRSGVARVTLNRPEVHNSYHTPMLEEMRDAFRCAAWDDQVGVMVLTGEGRSAFCTGGDVKEYAEVYTRRPRDYWKYMGLFAEAVDALRRTGKPTIARVNGMAVGGGNELHLACDLSVAAEHAVFRQVGTRVGSVAAGGATQWLPLAVGDRRAREMLLLCEPVTSTQALQWGLVNRVVPEAKLDETVADLAAKLLEKFPECTRYTKQQVDFWKDLAWNATIGHAREWLSLHFASLEPYEGMRAFVEKRPADVALLRERAASGGSSEFLWGPYVRRCLECGTSGLPEAFEHCGRCGSPLKREGAPDA